MWGNILTEFSYLQNFNMGFSNNKSDILIHLTQWQYWWWFWFTFLWVLYYLLVARVFRYRTLKFNPRIASTLRPHGKWGDLLTCLIPITWCINILINSNFILKLIEWQSESSLFTLRVRAKQWYWIYKLDLRNISDIYSAPRSLGRNKWQSSTFGDLQTSEDYLHLIQMRAYNIWAQEYWTELEKKFKKRHKWHVSSPVECYKFEFLANAKLTELVDFSEKNSFFKIEKKNNFPFLKNQFIDNESNNILFSTKSLLYKHFIRNDDNLAEFQKITDIRRVSLRKIKNFKSGKPSNSFSVNYGKRNITFNYTKHGRLGNKSFYKNNYFHDFHFRKLTFSKKTNSLIKFKYDFTPQKSSILFESPKTGFYYTDDKKQFVKKSIKPIISKIYFGLQKESSAFANIAKINDDPKNQTFPDLVFPKKKIHIRRFAERRRLDPIKKKKIDISHGSSLKPSTFNRSIEQKYSSFLKNSLSKDSVTPTRFIRHPDYDEETRIIRMNFGKVAPIRILKKPYSDVYFSKNENKDFELFRFRFNSQKSTLVGKPIRPTVYLTFKQKRYTLKNNISKSVLNVDNVNYSTNPFIKGNSIIEENLNSPTRQYKLIKKAKNRAENFNVQNWNRLLRSRRVLVLPAHVNITVITNSFDIVHSWHIPGLGLKMDCLPGRATHHTLYIDNVGFYYGQCAEVCGRYHHHMPIRICALPFEHFLVWWHTFGLPKLLFLKDTDKATFNLNTYMDRKFSW